MAVEEPDQEGGDGVAGARLRQQGAALAPAQHARSDHQVGAILDDRRHQQRQLLGVIGVVGVDEDDDGGRAGRAQVGEGRQAGAAVAVAGRVDHLGAAGARHLGGAVARVVVGDDDAPDAGAAQGSEHQRQRGLLVEGRDDDVDRGLAWRWHRPRL